MSAQSRYEFCQDKAMDDFHDYFTHDHCEKCGVNIDGESGDFCQNCQKQQEEEKHDEQL
jgi:hypothetical protein